MVLPITKNWEIVYIKEFRYWVEDFIIWFPVWIQENNLTQIENTKKELEEETWYKSNEIIYLGETISWNYEDTIIKLYFAKNCEEWIQDLETWEVIEVFNTNLKNFENIILWKNLICPLSMTAFTLARLKWLI